MIDILSFSEKMPAPKTHRFTRNRNMVTIWKKKKKKAQCSKPTQPEKKNKRIEKEYFLIIIIIFIILSFKILNLNKKVFSLYH